jgi:hypothetical protein
MYIALNNERIIYNFDKGILVRMSGPDESYYVEVKEYLKNDETPYTVESYPISPKKSFCPYFKLPIEFYGDWEILIYKYVPEHGMNRIFSHRFNDYGKLVRFILKTESYEECKLWVKRVQEYVRIHACTPIVETPFDDINKSFITYYNIPYIDVYKTYNIGRFPKDSTDYRTLDPRKKDLIWFGNWKTFWSYQHPRKWTELSSQEIADDILGLS